MRTAVAVQPNNNSGGGGSVDSLIGNLSPLDEKMPFICGKKRAKLLVPGVGVGNAAVDDVE